ncbi:flagellin lysine-N-methylase [Paenibacillus sp. WQ 127069]|uniref:Flagellin lysine-N-methylase n=1 Tax=Paenibacillus baimaensis TaxID=2982185 RepID=A0ABT2UEA2_9BACL|nr:flagellin lysine-N-methylase [Paenibacillus sp. WQ 127069]MCU6792940.1 flagellin lysine-N-methylase [Paenibacillus sp. WQ 127069]
MRNRTLLVPKYMNEFNCIGTACEDTCCVGWRVEVDKPTYKKYNQLVNSDLKLLLDKHVKRNRSNPSDSKYAKIKLASGGACPMLTEERLCKIQGQLGETYLSDVCATYPRVTNIVNNIMEKSATMSCPEAARLALLNPEGIEFDEVEELGDVRSIISKTIDTSNKIMSNKLERYFWELRIFSIHVLQDRRYSLTDRLVILGFFYQKLEEYKNDSRISEIPVLIGSFSNMLEDGSIKESLSGVPSHAAVQMELLKELADERIFSGVSNQRYFECFAAFLHGIQYNLDDSVEDIAERYDEAYTKYYLPFMENYEYILENYLVNYVYKNTFPLGMYSSVFDEYVLMVLHYGLIKMHLIGMSRFYKENFNLDLVITLIQSFAKTVEHNNQYIGHIMKLMEKNNYKSMAYMAILIKN